MGLEKVLQWWGDNVDSEVKFKRRKFLLKTFGAFLDLEGKTGNALEAMVSEACLLSRKEKRQVDINIDGTWDIQKAHLDILPGANIKLCGGGKIINTLVDKAGQIESLFEWGSQKHNILDISLPFGSELTIENLIVDGGWEDINASDKRAESPWDALVRIKSEGGKVNLKNLEFANSINPGITVDGAGECRAIGLKGDKLDACLVVTTTSKNVFVGDCTATNMLSDGFMFAGNTNVRASNLKVEGSPHGIMLHGNTDAKLTTCEVRGSMEAFNTSNYGKINRAGKAMFDGCSSSGCLIPFAFSDTDEISVVGGIHDNVGGPNDFLRGRLETPLISVYVKTVKELEFNGVIMRLDPNKLDGYQTPHFYGLVYQYYRSADSRIRGIYRNLQEFRGT